MLGGWTAWKDANATDPTGYPIETADSTPALPAVTATTASTGNTPGKYFIIETEKGQIVARLYTQPEANVGNTITNFEQKANSKTFDGRIFHRVEEWVVQGGDPQGDGTGGGDIPSEYNQLQFKVGALGVARGADPAINNDSQFFIVKDAAAASGLVGQYTNFGEVVEGMEVVNALEIGDTITSIRVEER